MPVPVSGADRPRVWVTNPARSGLFGWLFRYYVFAGLGLLIAAGAVGHRIYRGYAAELPDLGAVEQYDSIAPGVTRIYARDGSVLAELAREHRAYASIDEIPEPLINAFLAAEDRRFYSHAGLDWRGLARAIRANLRSGTVVQGGSTITQQVAKGFLGDERTIDRKLREAILSVRMESRLGKRRILEIYLNKIFLGHGAYGVAAAASRYFGKDLDELTLAESALIAGMARAPSRYSPVLNQERALARRKVVLQDMVEAGFISAAERDAAVAEELRLVAPVDVFRLRAPYYAEQVRREVVDRFGEASVLQDGLQIETPAQLSYSEAAHDAIDAAVRKLDRRQGWRGPVAHLADAAAQTTFQGRAEARYGDSALVDDPHRWRLGLVTAVDKKGAKIKVGRVEASLPLKRMNWAYRYDRNATLNDATITRADEALAAGDVVWVRPYRKRKAQVAEQADELHDPRKPTLGSGEETPQKPEDGPLAPPPEPEKDKVELDGETGLPMLELGQTPRLEALLYTQSVDSGYVDTMEGGLDYDRSQFNRTTQACRQPGSVFKAFYYSLALDGAYRMDSILQDTPWVPENGEAWDPKNLGDTLDGEVLLRTAMIRSLNLPSIRLFLALGADNVVAYARRMGITTELIADRALSLGASCTHVHELVRAFSIWVRGGSWIDPVFVRRVTNKRGEVLLDARDPGDPVVDVAGRLDRIGTLALRPPKQVVDDRTSFLTIRLLREVVTAGIGARAARINVPVGGKTGTASKYTNVTDTWFVGFTSREVTAAWMGDDTYQRSLGEEDASYTTTVPMWQQYMNHVVDGVPHDQVPRVRPPGLTSKVVDARTGKDPVPGMPQATLYYKD
ncbi:MAG: PBP1A family penicillin-binding protein [Myxococcales bacterium]|nr:PBP1A family penicillin-binding protein [Myxococcales bacterium]